MKINEIERQMASQYSAMQAFPSQTPTLEHMFSGQNQRAAIEVQIEAAKLLNSQQKKLEKLNEVVSTLYKMIEMQHVASQERQKLEDQRYVENTRLSRIAAWSGVGSIVVGVILAAIGVWVQLALK